MTWERRFQHHYSPICRRKKKWNLIFEIEDFLSDSSDNVNPLQLKLNVAALVRYCIESKTGHQSTCWMFLSEHSTMLSTCRQDFFFLTPLFLFYLIFFSMKKKQKKKHWTRATTAVFQVLGSAETLRNKCYNFNRRGAHLQTDFQCRRSDSRDHSLQFSASSALKRCWADVRHLIPGQLLNKKQRLTKQRLCVCARVYASQCTQTHPHTHIYIYVFLLAHIFDAAFTMHLQSGQL